jgi:hypothetical protein
VAQNTKSVACPLQRRNITRTDLFYASVDGEREQRRVISNSDPAALVLRLSVLSSTTEFASSLNTSCLMYEISRPWFHGDSWIVNLSTWRQAYRCTCICYVSDRKRPSDRPFAFSNASPAFLQKKKKKRATCLLRSSTGL